MGYISRLEGDLSFTYKGNENLPKEFPADFVRAAKENGVTLPDLSTPRVGISRAALDNLKNSDRQLTYMFDFSNQEAEQIGESGKFYDLDSDLEEIVRIVKEDECFVNGTVIRWGEENGDVERFVITDNKITNEKAILRWPDGSKAE